MDVREATPCHILKGQLKSCMSRLRTSRSSFFAHHAAY